MEQKIEGAILSAVLAITLIVSAFTFSLTGIKISNFNTLNVIPLTQLTFSANFGIFLLISALSIAIILMIAKKFFGKNNSFFYATIFAETGFIAGAAIGAIIFKLTDFLVPALFICIGIPIGIKLLEAREKELKVFVSFRAGSEAAGKIALFAAIGFFIYLIVINSANSKEYEANFTSDLINATVGDQGNLKEQIMNAQIDATIQTQKALLNQLGSTQQFNVLREKTDADTIAYVAMADAINEQINSDEYRATLTTAMQNELAKNAGSGDMASAIENALPLKKIAPYAWIIYPIVAFLFVLFVSGLVTGNLAGIYYALITLIYPGKKPETA
ncbi:MAG: hypothetical protein NTZ73_03340 [Candidatus Diapherotrites archaeon]|nr:hypothetical protein [Candidatus Diapherotrites archaeon]